MHTITVLPGLLPISLEGFVEVLAWEWEEMERTNFLLLSNMWRIKSPPVDASTYTYYFCARTLGGIAYVEYHKGTFKKGFVEAKERNRFVQQVLPMFK